MDPLSALGLAANIVQFVDFGSKLLSSAYELQKSPRGQLEEHTELEKITKNLLTTSNDFKASVSTRENRCLSSNEKELQTLCDECNTLAEQLLGALIKLKGAKKNKLKNLEQALKILWGQERIESMQKRLDGFRQQLVVSILGALREQVASTRQEQLVVSEKLDHVAELNKRLAENFLENISERQRWRSELLDAIRTRSIRDEESSLISEMAVPVLHNVYSGSSLAAQFGRTTMLRLKFQEMPDRHERIAHAYQKTYEWIFKSRKDLTRPWANFVTWLKGDSSVYWITGKPGAGKSTLMKFIYDDTRTHQYLKQQATSSEIVVAGFFFWNSGTSMQMSQEGLLRTLLHDILRQCEDLLPFAFPDRWESYYLFKAYEHEHKPWLWLELVRALKMVIKEGSLTRRFVLFVDGLDEFSGDHKELLDLLFSLITLGNVKMCVASRPWTVFEDTFKGNPSLLLQDLTYPDIKHYVTSKLHSNPGFEALKFAEPRYASRLVEDVVKKSSGVFLWVALVVDLLMAGIANGDRVPDLQTKLDALPPDLEGFFDKILGGLEDAYKQHAFELFQLVRHAERPLSLLQMYYADSGDLDSAILQPYGVITSQERDLKAEIMRRRLNSRCKGLLEAPRIDRDDGPGRSLADAPVYYLHRTVKDYIEKPQTWATILFYTQHYFDPHLFLSVAYLMQLKTESLSVAALWDYVAWCMHYCAMAAGASTLENGAAIAVRIMDSLDSAADVGSRRQADIPSLVEQACTTSPARDITYWTQLHHQIQVRPSDFLSLAASCQLSWYVREKIKTDYLDNRDLGLCPPLLAAVTNYASLLPYKGRFKLSHSHASLEMVEVLLNAGDKPNSIHNGLTAWNQVIHELQHSHHFQSWVPIADLLLQYGADPKAPGAERVIKRFFPSRLPPPDPNSAVSKRSSRTFSSLKKAFNLKRSSRPIEVMPPPVKTQAQSVSRITQPYGGITFTDEAKRRTGSIVFIPIFPESEGEM